MTRETSPSSTPIIRAVIRALDVLDSFAGKDAQSLAEVSAATGLDKGTTRRLLITLMQKDYVVRDSVTQNYRLGPAIRGLAAYVGEMQDLRATAHSALVELASELGVTAFLSVFRDDTAVCLDRVHDMRGIEVHWWAVGGTLPLNVGGAPKLLLAYQPEDQIDRLLDGSTEPMNAQSITDRTALRERLALIRERGWECAVDDVTLGLTALAVPVLDRDGAPVCVVSIAGLTPQMVEDGKPTCLERVQATAARVRRDLGIRD